MKRNGCDSCQVVMINGHRCHETGCPDAWKDARRECKWCGASFRPDGSNQRFCEQSCAEAYA